MTQVEVYSVLISHFDSSDEEFDPPLFPIGEKRFENNLKLYASVEEAEEHWNIKLFTNTYFFIVKISVDLKYLLEFTRNPPRHGGLDLAVTYLEVIKKL